MFHFYTSWKREKTSGFIKFSGGIEIVAIVARNGLIKFCGRIVFSSFPQTKQKQLREVFTKEAVLKNFVIFTEKHLFWSPYSPNAFLHFHCCKTKFFQCFKTKWNQVLKRIVNSEFMVNSLCNI